MATQRKDGRWMARAKCQAGKTIYGYGKSPEDAESELAAKLAAMSTPSISPAASLHDVAKLLWFPSIAHLRPLSQKKYTGVYVNHIRDKIGHKRLDELTTGDVQALVSQYKKQPAMAGYIRDLVGQILRCAESEGLLVRNAARFVKVPPKAEKRVRVLTVEQAQKLLGHVAGTDLSAPVFFAAVLGLRRGELAGLHWSDLDRQRGELRVQRQRQALRPNGVQETELKTTQSRRTLQLPKELIDQIDERGNLDHPTHICTYRGEPWVPDTLTELWGGLRSELGLNDWHFHDLRHGSAGLLYAAGNDLIEIAAVLGQVKPDMSLMYTDITRDRQAKAISSLSEMLGFR